MWCPLKRGDANLDFWFKVASCWQHLTTFWNLSLTMLEHKEDRVPRINRSWQSTWCQRTKNPFLEDRLNLIGKCQVVGPPSYGATEPESLTLWKQIWPYLSSTVWFQNQFWGLGQSETLGSTLFSPKLMLLSSVNVFSISFLTSPLPF